MHVLLTRCLSACLLMAALTTQAQEVPGARPDHTIFVNVDSEPSGAGLYAVPADGDGKPERIGTTPMMVVVGLTWEERFGRKKWETLRVWSAGGNGEGIFGERQKYCDIFVNLAAVKRGHGAAKVRQNVGRLSHPGVSWSVEEGWPTEYNLKIRIPSNEEAKRQAGAGGLAPSVGSAKIIAESSVKGATVLIDDKPMGTVPAEIELPSGSYVLKISKEGYSTYIRQIKLGDGDRQLYHADLKQSPN